MIVAATSLMTVCRFPSADGEAPNGEHTVVWLRGEHDMANVAGLAETIESAIVRDADVILDLRGVEFMDASTVTVIVGADERLRAGSRSLVVRCPSRCARRVLELCGLSHLLVEASPMADPDSGGVVSTS